MLVFLVKGLFHKFELPYCQFPCTALSGSFMGSSLAVRAMWTQCYGSYMWWTCFKLVIFNLHNPTTKHTMIHSRQSIYWYHFIFSDPPHLIKTVRDCWTSKSRHLWLFWYFRMLKSCYYLFAYSLTHLGAI